MQATNDDKTQTLLVLSPKKKRTGTVKAFLHTKGTEGSREPLELTLKPKTSGEMQQEIAELVNLAAEEKEEMKKKVGILCYVVGLHLCLPSMNVK